MVKRDAKTRSALDGDSDTSDEDPDQPSFSLRGNMLLPAIAHLPRRSDRPAATRSRRTKMNDVREVLTPSIKRAIDVRRTRCGLWRRQAAVSG